MSALRALFCALLLASLLRASPQETDARSDYDYQLPQTSPDGRHLIEFTETSAHVMLYRWVQLKPRKVLLEIKSGYQPDKSDPAASSYARGKAEEAMAFWSKDSRHVAIEEAVNHGSGKTLAAFLAGPDRAELIKIPEDRIADATGEQWRRSRFGFQHWGDKGVLQLVLTGDALAHKDDRSDTPKLRGVSYLITLQRVGVTFGIRKVDAQAIR